MKNPFKRFFSNRARRNAEETKSAVNHDRAKAERKEKTNSPDDRPKGYRRSGFRSADDLKHVGGQGRIAARYFRVNSFCIKKV